MVVDPAEAGCVLDHRPFGVEVEGEDAGGKDGSRPEFDGAVDDPLLVAVLSIDGRQVLAVAVEIFSADLPRPDPVPGTDDP